MSQPLIDNLPLIAAAPDGIKALRGLILDLAVRGKLVPQDPEDETAEEMLKRIGAERQRNGKGKKRQGDGVIAATEQFPPPLGWTWCRFFDIAEIRTELVRPEDYEDFIQVAPDCIEKGTGRLTSKRTVKESGVRGPNARFYAGQVLYSKIRPSLSKAVIVDFDGLCSADMYPLDSFIEREFLLTLILSPYFLDQVREAENRVKMPKLNQESLAQFTVCVAPLAEQRRIVAKVDELMALCDRLEAQQADAEAVHATLVKTLLETLTQSQDADDFAANWQRLSQHFPTIFTTEASVDALKQAVLQLAVIGKLAQQNSSDEPASELLKRIREAKALRKMETGDARIKVAPDPTPDELEIQLPPGWSVQSFENLFLFIDYRGNTPPKTEGGVPLITAKNIRMGYLNREPREYVSEETFTEWMTRGFPAIGDLLFTTEAPLANICLNDINEPFALAQRAICFQPYGKINTKYLMFAVMSGLMQSLIDKHATGMTARGIKASNLKPLPIPIPPLAEQHRIVAKVDELLALCDTLKAQITESRKIQRLLAVALIDQTLAA